MILLNDLEKNNEAFENIKAYRKELREEEKKAREIIKGMMR